MAVGGWARLPSGVLFGIETTEPVTLIGGPLVLLLTAAVASSAPGQPGHPITALWSD
jgi:hypothetical protein